MLQTGNSQQLSDDLFRLFRDYIYQKSGIYFKDTNKYLLERRLLQRMKQINAENFKQYYYFLLYDPKSMQELDDLYDSITTNETYFFREERQLKAFIDEIVPDIIQKKNTLRIWSAGCSSGEEPYTLAILLKEKRYFERAKIDIYGSDISQQALKRARKGIYREISFRAETAGKYKGQYFHDMGDGTYRIIDEIKEKVSFGKLNLMDVSRASLLGNLDIILCRNVIIYFDDQSKRKVVDMLHDRLYSGGFLLLGHSESLISITTKFRLKHLKNDMVYQK